MPEALTSAVAILFYILLARLAVRGLRGMARDIAFAFLNLAGLYFFFYTEGRNGIVFFTLYLVWVCLQYILLRLFSGEDGWKSWLAFFAPIFALIFVRYMPMSFYAGLSLSFRIMAATHPEMTVASRFIGISYLAFRSSYLVLEIRNGKVPLPNLFQYLGFCFFVPTLSVGPISHYENHLQGFAENRPQIPVGRACLRILVGLVKFQFLGTVFSQLAYSGLLLDDHLHPWIDLPIAVIFYYLFLYCNFSGFCDMAIGAAGLIGIPVSENFLDPLAARNMREFWNRWHITLSQYMRDVVFSPLSKYLTRLLGPQNVNHAVALTIVVVFLLIGIWHGTGWNYAVFGLLQALGVVTTHYYTLGLKKWLGRDGFKAYNANRLIRAAAIVVTFCYYAVTLFFFANSPAQMEEIFSVLR
jgi:D-alanyl-lipoteichoic acid acyltransferase DltB (MBOAT superfamily)